jgi:hypothetical protein
MARIGIRNAFVVQVWRLHRSLTIGIWKVKGLSKEWIWLEEMEIAREVDIDVPLSGVYVSISGRGPGIYCLGIIELGGVYGSMVMADDIAVQL